MGKKGEPLAVVVVHGRQRLEALFFGRAGAIRVYRLQVVPFVYAR